MKSAATSAMRRHVVPPIAMPAVWDLLRGGGGPLASPPAASVLVSAGDSLDLEAATLPV